MSEDEVGEPYWEALRQHRLRIQRCPDCARWVFHPRTLCPHCYCTSLEWREISGRGRLLAALPTGLAVVELDEGPHLTGVLVNVRSEDVRVGMRIRPFFDDRPPAEVTLLRFEPDPG